MGFLGLRMILEVSAQIFSAEIEFADAKTSLTFNGIHSSSQNTSTQGVYMGMSENGVYPQL